MGLELLRSKKRKCQQRFRSLAFFLLHTNTSSMHPRVNSLGLDALASASGLCGGIENSVSNLFHDWRHLVQFELFARKSHVVQADLDLLALDDPIAVRVQSCVHRSLLAAATDRFDFP